MKCSASELLLFRDALVAAFAKRSALEEFAVATELIVSFEVDIDGRTLKEQALAFLRLAQAEGEAALDKVLAQALERRPNNDTLRAFATKVGTVRAANVAELLHTRALDLRPLEEVWRKALSVPRKRLVIFVLCCVDDAVVNNVIERLRLHLGVPASTSVSPLSLDEKIRPVDKTIELIVRLKPRLATEHVVCRLNADNAPDDAIERLLPRLFEAYAEVLNHHLVLLLKMRPDGKLPAQCALLPSPRFQDTDLYEWVEDVTRDKGWPADLRDEFKLWLYRAVDEAEFPLTDMAYFALDNAISLLSQELPQAALRKHFKPPP